MCSFSRWLSLRIEGGQGHGHAHGHESLEPLVLLPVPVCVPLPVPASFRSGLYSEQFLSKLDSMRCEHDGVIAYFLDQIGLG